MGFVVVLMRRFGVVMEVKIHAFLGETNFKRFGTSQPAILNYEE